jgi:diguanylate cyclase (GGDEF)-like protein
VNSVIWLFSFLLFSCLLVEDVVAFQQVTASNHKQQVFMDNSAPLQYSNSMPVDPKIMRMAWSLNTTPNNNVVTLIENLSGFVPANPAEEYLMLLLRFQVNQDKQSDLRSQRYKKSVEKLVVKAKQLSQQVPDQQLVQPVFMQWHHVLAEYYVQQGQFEQAVTEKNKYLAKYYDYLRNRRLSMIEVLGRSFEMKDKKATNALLKSQNQLKMSRVTEIQKNKNNRQYQLTLIICSAIMFVVLFIKQLKLSHKLLIHNKTDSTTGLLNRTAFFKQGLALVNSHKIELSNLSLLLLDIDHFKKINDKVGYEIGDSVLKEVSLLIQESMRSRDLLSRIEADHFTAILPFADQHTAKAIALRIKSKIEEHNFAHLIVKQKVTVSIGIASLDEKTVNFDSLFRDTDIALEYAKEQGRNTVIHYQSIINL